ncbi:MAG TPA: cytochrome c biogenesis protein CcsA [Methylomirabilota bacterium]|nr:cytochrome c biogenesis protein CcsA [Methylomirabilota bacterium]
MTVLGWLTALGLVAGLVMDFGIAPREMTQGNVQRIMYVHVPAVWVAYLAFIVGLIGSIAYLARRRPGADRIAHAACEVGTVFLGVNIATGAIWGKPTWGTWWTWDARLTSVSVVFVMFLAYLLLRGAIDDEERAARYSAVLGIVAALNIPLVHFSVYWWRTLHQPPSLLKPGSSTMPPVILTALLVSFAALALLGAYFIVRRARVLALEQEALA